MKTINPFIPSVIAFLLFSCTRQVKTVTEAEVFPVVITDTTLNDTDDPAIWINKNEPEKSLILGTDKGDSTGGIFVFDLQGKLIPDLCLYHLQRPNNIDVEYGYKHHDRKTDIAVFTERGRDRIRVIQLPECKFIDNGDIPVFEDDSLKSPMGVALYKNRKNEVYAFVSRKTGPENNYIYQYRLFSDSGIVKAEKVRSFGKFSGKKEIESIAVDDDLGYVYYSDETVGIRKYYAEPGKGNEELALFGTTGFQEDNEGISIYKNGRKKGFIIVSDQQANTFHIFSREGSKGNPHDHPLLRIVKIQTEESDGSEITHFKLNTLFKKGIFVAMSSDKTFHYYKAEDIIGE